MAMHASEVLTAVREAPRYEFASWGTDRKAIRARVDSVVVFHRSNPILHGFVTLRQADTAARLYIGLLKTERMGLAPMDRRRAVQLLRQCWRRDREEALLALGLVPASDSIAWATAESRFLFRSIGEYAWRVA